MLSGKFVLRLDPQMHHRLKEEAQSHGESLNSWCIQKLTETSISTKGHEILPRLVQEFDPLGIILFGSTARGEATAASDIDLLIVLSSKDVVDRDKYRRWDKIVVADSPYSPQFVQLPLPKESLGSIWLETAMEGEVLYDPSGRIKKTLREIRQEIASGQYQRKQSHGHAYWIRQDSNAE